MPLLAILLSVLGLIPFIACGLAALGPDRSRRTGCWRPDRLRRGGPCLRGRRAVGLRAAINPAGHVRAAGAARVGVLPLLIGWIALLLPLVVASWLSLIVLIAAYIGAVLVEHGRRNVTCSRRAISGYAGASLSSPLP